MARNARVMRKAKEEGREIASERISILFDKADEAALSGNLLRADGYVSQARDIAMKFNMRLTPVLRGRYCSFCNRYLLAGKTSKTRTNPKERRVEVECLVCGRKSFHPYAKESNDRRRIKNESGRAGKDTDRKTGSDQGGRRRDKGPDSQEAGR